MDKLENYFNKDNIKIVLTSLCLYEKRKNIPTEQEYFISKYGIEIYNSGRHATINESIKINEPFPKLGIMIIQDWNI